MQKAGSHQVPAITIVQLHCHIFIAFKFRYIVLSCSGLEKKKKLNKKLFKNNKSKKKI